MALRVSRERIWSCWPYFTDQAYNLILLADDEARMLGRPAVEPEHLLLALTRHGNIRSLFERRGVSGTDVFDEIVRAHGIGDELVLGRVPRSTPTDAALDRAVDIAAHRDVLGRSSDLPARGGGGDSGRAGWRGSWPRPVSTTSTSWSTASPGTDARRSATRTSSRTCCRIADRRSAPQPGPIPPVFERYTAGLPESTLPGIAAADLVLSNTGRHLHP